MGESWSLRARLAVELIRETHGRGTEARVVQRWRRDIRKLARTWSHNDELGEETLRLIESSPFWPRFVNAQSSNSEAVVLSSEEIRRARTPIPRTVRVFVQRRTWIGWTLKTDRLEYSRNFARKRDLAIRVRRKGSERPALPASRVVYKISSLCMSSRISHLHRDRIFIQELPGYVTGITFG